MLVKGNENIDEVCLNTNEDIIQKLFENVPKIEHDQTKHFKSSEERNDHGLFQYGQISTREQFLEISNEIARFTLLLQRFPVAQNFQTKHFLVCDPHHYIVNILVGTIWCILM